MCKECHNKLSISWFRRHRKRTSQISVKAARTLREVLLNTFGRVCVKCGFDNPLALQLDHINGGGTSERRRLGQAGVWRRALKFPKEYQMLCANCNVIKAHTEKEYANRCLLQLNEVGS